MPDSIVTINNLSFTSYITEAQIRTRIQALAAEMKERYDGLQPIFLGVLNGAFIFAICCVPQILRALFPSSNSLPTGV